MKQIYTSLLACLLVMAAFTAVRAQSDFKPGFVVLASGDTLRGLVDYRANVLSSKVARYKEAASATVITYTSADIKGYGFPGDRYYASKYVKADSSQVFMEELVRSKINLYNMGGKFYVEKEGLGLEELEVALREYYSQDGVLHRTSANKHVATLNKYMSDCMSMIEKIERAALTQSSLIRLIKEYNECSPGVPVVVFKEEKRWFAVGFGVGVGINHTSLSFSAKDETYLHLENSDFGSSTYLVPSLMLNLRFPRISEYTSLQLEGGYFSTGYKDRSNTYDWFETKYENDMELSMSAVKLGLIARHEFSSKKLQPFVNAGMAINLFQDREIKHTQYVSRYGSSEERVRDDAEFVTNRQNNFIGGVGFLYGLPKGKLSAEIRYEYGLDIHSHERVNALSSYLSSSTNTISFTTGYYF